MKTIAITGSSRGIGFGLADELLKRGCAVVVGGRSAAASREAAGQLAARHGAERVLGQACDVTDYAQVQALWQAARQRFGRVDIWINNAGQGHPNLPFWEQPPAVMHDTVTTNLVGTLYGCRVALEGMRAQSGGLIYNVEGFGSSGSLQMGMGIYGSTKAATSYLTRAIALDARHLPVRLGSIRPGMILTDLVLGQFAGREAELERSRRIFNIIADRVEHVTPFLAERILAGQLRITWLTPARLLWRFLTSPLSRRDLFADLPGR